MGCQKEPFTWHTVIVTECCRWDVLSDLNL